MSKFLKKGYYEGRALETQWINATFSIHDLFCGCLDPINHLKEIHKQQCHPTKDVGIGTETTGDNDDDVIKPGDLEELFKEENTANQG